MSLRLPEVCPWTPERLSPFIASDRSGECPVFQSRKGGHINRHQLWRIVSAAAKQAGIEGKVSPHWLRHAHASHSLDRGAPIHLVQQTLGHESVAATSRYLHARPNDSSSLYLP
ncbi:tyrosine-type recombinase/integrase [Leptolyngbya sp. FACHB-321]|nr:tyrosine-type recombinase/integrase [Leptolyngbya sp. FACHB-321]